MKRLLLCLGFLATTSCVTPSLVVKAKNEPDADGLTGKNFYIAVSDKNHNPVKSATANEIKSIASQFLIKHKFKKASSPKNAHTIIEFGLFSDTKQVYVPGQTYSVPIYGNSSGTTSTVKDSYGQTVGTVETASNSNPYAPTGYQTHYREGYSQDQNQQLIMLVISSQEYGRRPIIVSQGTAGYDQYNQDFFGDSDAIKSSIESLLTQTMLSLPEMSLAITDKPPGCWPVVGMNFDKNGKISEVTPRSPASESGIHPGDTVKSYYGLTPEAYWNSTRRPKENEKVEIIYQHDGQEKVLNIQTRIICRD